MESRTLYRRHYYTGRNEMKAQDRILRLLLTIFNDYFESNLVPAKKIFEKSAKAIINIFIEIRRDYGLNNSLLENMTKVLLKKMGHLEKIEALTGKNLPCPLDTCLKNDPIFEIYKNTSTSDYGTDDGSSNGFLMDDETDDIQIVSETTESSKDIDKATEEHHRPTDDVPMILSRPILTIFLDHCGPGSDEETECLTEEVQPTAEQEKKALERTRRLHALQEENQRRTRRRLYRIQEEFRKKNHKPMQDVKGEDVNIGPFEKGETDEAKQVNHSKTTLETIEISDGDECTDDNSVQSAITIEDSKCSSSNTIKVQEIKQYNVLCIDITADEDDQVQESPIILEKTEDGIYESFTKKLAGDIACLNSKQKCTSEMRKSTGLEMICEDIEFLATTSHTSQSAVEVIDETSKDDNNIILSDSFEEDNVNNSTSIDLLAESTSTSENTISAMHVVGSNSQNTLEDIESTKTPPEEIILDENILCSDTHEEASQVAPLEIGSTSVLRIEETLRGTDQNLPLTPISSSVEISTLINQSEAFDPILSDNSQFEVSSTCREAPLFIPQVETEVSTSINDIEKGNLAIDHSGHSHSFIEQEETTTSTENNERVDEKDNKLLSDNDILNQLENVNGTIDPFELSNKEIYKSTCAKATPPDNQSQVEGCDENLTEVEYPVSVELEPERLYSDISVSLVDRLENIIGNCEKPQMISTGYEAGIEEISNHEDAGIEEINKDNLNDLQKNTNDTTQLLEEIPTYDQETSINPNEIKNTNIELPVIPESHNIVESFDMSIDKKDNINSLNDQSSTPMSGVSSNCLEVSPAMTEKLSDNEEVSISTSLSKDPLENINKVDYEIGSDSSSSDNQVDISTGKIQQSAIPKEVECEIGTSTSLVDELKNSNSSNYVIFDSLLAKSREFDNDADSTPIRDIQFDIPSKINENSAVRNNSNEIEESYAEHDCDEIIETSVLSENQTENIDPNTTIDVEFKTTIVCSYEYENSTIREKTPSNIPQPKIEAIPNLQDNVNNVENTKEQTEDIIDEPLLSHLSGNIGVNSDDTNQLSTNICEEKISIAPIVELEALSEFKEKTFLPTDHSDVNLNCGNSPVMEYNNSEKASPIEQVTILSENLAYEFESSISLCNDTQNEGNEPLTHAPVTLKNQLIESEVECAINDSNGESEMGNLDTISEEEVIVELTEEIHTEDSFTVNQHSFISQDPAKDNPVSVSPSEEFLASLELVDDIPLPVSHVEIEDSTETITQGCFDGIGENQLSIQVDVEPREKTTALLQLEDADQNTIPLDTSKGNIGEFTFEDMVINEIEIVSSSESVNKDCASQIHDEHKQDTHNNDEEIKDEPAERVYGTEDISETDVTQKKEKDRGIKATDISGNNSDISVSSKSEKKKSIIHLYNSPKIDRLIEKYSNIRETHHTSVTVDELSKPGNVFFSQISEPLDLSVTQSVQKNMKNIENSPALGHLDFQESKIEDDLNLHSEEIVATTSKGREVFSIPDAANMLLLASTAEIVREEHNMSPKSESKIIRRRTVQRKKQTPKKLEGFKEVNKRVTRSQTTKPLYLSSFSPTDVLAIKSYSPTAKKIYTQKLSDFSVTSEESNDSESNKLMIDEDICSKPTGSNQTETLQLKENEGSSKIGQVTSKVFSFQGEVKEVEENRHFAIESGTEYTVSQFLTEPQLHSHDSQNSQSCDDLNYKSNSSRFKTPGQRKLYGMGPNLYVNIQNDTSIDEKDLQTNTKEVFKKQHVDVDELPLAERIRNEAAISKYFKNDSTKSKLLEFPSSEKSLGTSNNSNEHNLVTVKTYPAIQENKQFEEENEKHCESETKNYYLLPKLKNKKNMQRRKSSSANDIDDAKKMLWKSKKNTVSPTAEKLMKKLYNLESPVSTSIENISEWSDVKIADQLESEKRNDGIEVLNGENDSQSLEIDSLIFEKANLEKHETNMIDSFEAVKNIISSTPTNEKCNIDKLMVSANVDVLNASRRKKGGRKKIVSPNINSPSSVKTSPDVMPESERVRSKQKIKGDQLKKRVEEKKRQNDLRSKNLEPTILFSSAETSIAVESTSDNFKKIEEINVKNQSSKKSNLNDIEESIVKCRQNVMVLSEFCVPKEEASTSEKQNHSIEGFRKTSKTKSNNQLNLCTDDIAARKKIRNHSKEKIDKSRNDELKKKFSVSKKMDLHSSKDTNEEKTAQVSTTVRSRTKSREIRELEETELVKTERNKKEQKLEEDNPIDEPKPMKGKSKPKQDNKSIIVYSDSKRKNIDTCSSNQSLSNNDSKEMKVAEPKKGKSIKSPKPSPNYNISNIENVIEIPNQNDSLDVKSPISGRKRMKSYSHNPKVENSIGEEKLNYTKNKSTDDINMDGKKQEEVEDKPKIKRSESNLRKNNKVSEGKDKNRFDTKTDTEKSMSRRKQSFVSSSSMDELKIVTDVLEDAKRENRRKKSSSSSESTLYSDKEVNSVTKTKKPIESISLRKKSRSESTSAENIADDQRTGVVKICSNVDAVSSTEGDAIDYKQCEPKRRKSGSYSRAMPHSHEDMTSKTKNSDSTIKIEKETARPTISKNKTPRLGNKSKIIKSEFNDPQKPFLITKTSEKKQKRRDADSKCLTKVDSVSPNRSERIVKLKCQVPIYGLSERILSVKLTQGTFHNPGLNKKIQETIEKEPSGTIITKKVNVNEEKCKKSPKSRSNSRTKNKQHEKKSRVSSSPNVSDGLNDHQLAITDNNFPKSTSTNEGFIEDVSSSIDIVGRNTSKNELKNESFDIQSINHPVSSTDENQMTKIERSECDPEIAEGNSQNYSNESGMLFYSDKERNEVNINVDIPVGEIQIEESEKETVHSNDHKNSEFTDDDHKDVCNESSQISSISNTSITIEKSSEYNLPEKEDIIVPRENQDEEFSEIERTNNSSNPESDILVNEENKNERNEAFLVEHLNDLSTKHNKEILNLATEKNIEKPSFDPTITEKPMEHVIVCDKHDNLNLQVNLVADEKEEIKINQENMVASLRVENEGNEEIEHGKISNISDNKTNKENHIGKEYSEDCFDDNTHQSNMNVEIEKTIEQENETKNNDNEEKRDCVSPISPTSIYTIPENKDISKSLIEDDQNKKGDLSSNEKRDKSSSSMAEDNISKSSIENDNENERSTVPSIPSPISEDNITESLIHPIDNPTTGENVVKPDILSRVSKCANIDGKFSEENTHKMKNISSNSPNEVSGNELKIISIPTMPYLKPDKILKRKSKKGRSLKILKEDMCSQLPTVHNTEIFKSPYNKNVEFPYPGPTQSTVEQKQSENKFEEKNFDDKHEKSCNIFTSDSPSKETPKVGKKRKSCTDGFEENFNPVTEEQELENSKSEFLPLSVKTLKLTNESDDSIEGLHSNIVQHDTKKQVTENMKELEVFPEVSNSSLMVENEDITDTTNKISTECSSSINKIDLLSESEYQHESINQTHNNDLAVATENTESDYEQCRKSFEIAIEQSFDTTYQDIQGDDVKQNDIPYDSTIPISIRKLPETIHKANIENTINSKSVTREADTLIKSQDESTILISSVVDQNNEAINQKACDYSDSNTIISEITIELTDSPTRESSLISNNINADCRIPEFHVDNENIIPNNSKELNETEETSEGVINELEIGNKEKVRIDSDGDFKKQECVVDTFETLEENISQIECQSNISSLTDVDRNEIPIIMQVDPTECQRQDIDSFESLLNHSNEDKECIHCESAVPASTVDFSELRDKNSYFTTSLSNNPESTVGFLSHVKSNRQLNDTDGVSTHESLQVEMEHSTSSCQLHPKEELNKIVIPEIDSEVVIPSDESSGMQSKTDLLPYIYPSTSDAMPLCDQQMYAAQDKSLSDCFSCIPSAILESDASGQSSSQGNKDLVPFMSLDLDVSAKPTSSCINDPANLSDTCMSEFLDQVNETSSIRVQTSSVLQTSRSFDQDNLSLIPGGNFALQNSDFIVNPRISNMSSMATRGVSIVSEITTITSRESMLVYNKQGRGVMDMPLDAVCTRQSMNQVQISRSSRYFSRVSETRNEISGIPEGYHRLMEIKVSNDEDHTYSYNNTADPVIGGSIGGEDNYFSRSFTETIPDIPTNDNPLPFEFRDLITDDYKLNEFNESTIKNLSMMATNLKEYDIFDVSSDKKESEYTVEHSVNSNPSSFFSITNNDANDSPVISEQLEDSNERKELDCTAQSTGDILPADPWQQIIENDDCQQKVVVVPNNQCLPLFPMPGEINDRELDCSSVSSPDNISTTGPWQQIIENSPKVLVLPNDQCLTPSFNISNEDIFNSTTTSGYCSPNSEPKSEEMNSSSPKESLISITHSDIKSDNTDKKEPSHSSKDGSRRFDKLKKSKKREKDEQQEVLPTRKYSKTCPAKWIRNSNAVSNTKTSNQTKKDIISESISTDNLLRLPLAKASDNESIVVKPSPKIVTTLETSPFLPKTSSSISNASHPASSFPDKTNVNLCKTKDFHIPKSDQKSNIKERSSSLILNNILSSTNSSTANFLAPSNQQMESSEETGRKSISKIVDSMNRKIEKTAMLSSNTDNLLNPSLTRISENEPVIAKLPIVHMTSKKDSPKKSSIHDSSHLPKTSPLISDASNSIPFFTGKVIPSLCKDQAFQNTKSSKKIAEKERTSSLILNNILSPTTNSRDVRNVLAPRPKCFNLEDEKSEEMKRKALSSKKKSDGTTKATSKAEKSLIDMANMDIAETVKFRKRTATTLYSSSPDVKSPRITNTKRKRTPPSGGSHNSISISQPTVKTYQSREGPVTVTTESDYPLRIRLKVGDKSAKTSPQPPSDYSIDKILDTNDRGRMSTKRPSSGIDEKQAKVRKLESSRTTSVDDVFDRLKDEGPINVLFSSKTNDKFHDRTPKSSTSRPKVDLSPPVRKDPNRDSVSYRKEGNILKGSPRDFKSRSSGSHRAYPEYATGRTDSSHYRHDSVRTNVTSQPTHYPGHNPSHPTNAHRGHHQQRSESFRSYPRGALSFPAPSAPQSQPYRSGSTSAQHSARDSSDRYLSNRGSKLPKKQVTDLLDSIQTTVQNHLKFGTSEGEQHDWIKEINKRVDKSVLDPTVSRGLQFTHRRDFGGQK